MTTSTTLEAPKALVGTAKKKNIPVRWNMPNGLHGLVYASGHFVPYALERERDEALKNHKGLKPITEIVTQKEEEYRLKVVHRKQAIMPTVASNVRKCAALLRSGK